MLCDLVEYSYHPAFILFYFIFRLCWVFLAARGLSLVAASRGYSSLWCTGFSLWWLLLLRHTGPRASVVVACRLSSCGLRALEHRLSSCGTWALLLHGMWDLLGSSQTRAQTCIPCIGPLHWQVDS